MNNVEKPLFLRIQDCLSAMSGLDPSNPADLRRKLEAHTMLIKASRELSRAISCIGFGDMDDAAERIEGAERILKI